MLNLVTVLFELFKLEKECSRLLKEDKKFVVISAELNEKYKEVVTC